MHFCVGSVVECLGYTGTIIEIDRLIKVKFNDGSIGSFFTDGAMLEWDIVPKLNLRSQE